MRGIANAKQTIAAPVAQTIDLHGEQFDFVPVVEFAHAIAQELRHGHKVLLKLWQPSHFDLVEIAFRNHVAALPVIAPVDEHEQFPVPEKSECLLGIIGAF